MLPRTERLDLHDPHLLAFEAELRGTAERGGRRSLVLSRTAFFPEGGGQLGDRGVIELDGVALAVDDVQIDDDGVVHHLLAAEHAGYEATGKLARGTIDRARRRDHMSQHTGQHMLSRALLDLAGAETVSSRLGAEVSTIDVSAVSLAETALLEVEDAVTSAVLDARPVEILFPTPAELAGLPLRRQPTVTEGVRIVAIEGFDVSPCGGTHCTSTGAVGPVRILSTERYKGGTRVTFVAGLRAVRDYRQKDAALRGMSQGFSCGPLDVPQAVARLSRDLRTRTDELGSARGEVGRLLAAELLASAPPAAGGTSPLLVTRPEADLPALRGLAAALARRPDVVAIVRGGGEGPDVPLVIEVGSGATFDAGAFLKSLSRLHGARGGGRRERAEGRVPVAVDLAGALEAFRAGTTV